MRGWTARSIRTQLTGWYMAAVALMLIVYATATFLAVRHEFGEQLDNQLHEDFEGAEGALTRSADGAIQWNGERHHDNDTAEQLAFDVWSIAGERLPVAGSSTVLPPLTAAPPSAGYRYESIAVGGQRWRMLTGSHVVGDLPVFLRVTRSEQRLRGQLGEILTVLLLGLPLVTLLAGVGGYLLARRALVPIDHLASEARRITADRLHERLSVQNPHDEIGRLATVVNDTFARLESSFDQLRRFTADASHELRTPLAVIRGIGEGAVSDVRTAAEYRDVIGSMLEEVDRLTTLVDTLLRLSHGDAGTIRLVCERLDLGELASEIVSSLRILAEERSQRLTLTAAEPAIVSVDRLVLREAITNVVDNAIKYSPPDSTIEAVVRASDGHAIVSVADEGPGIAPEHRHRIFDRFFRIDEGRSRDAGGSGLGLAIARWAVEVNGGEVTVEQRPNGGALFRISLPLVEGATVGRGETTAP
jgi:heavy metal sensor kinase